MTYTSLLGISGSVAALLASTVYHGNLIGSISPGIPYELSNFILNAGAAGMLLHINAKFQWENLNQLFCRKVLFLTLS